MPNSSQGNVFIKVNDLQFGEKVQAERKSTQLMIINEHNCYRRYVYTMALRREFLRAKVCIEDAWTHFIEINKKFNC